MPRAALAKSYAMTHTLVVGEAASNGDFMITEARTFDFDGTYHVVFWEIPLANATDINITGLVELSPEGKVLQEYRRARSGEEYGTYTVRKSSSAVTVEANFEKTDVEAIFAIQYTVTGAVKAWADTGDVTWQAIGPDWEQSSNDVRVYLRLPVAAGDAIELGDNVRAWVDGPLDGIVGYDEESGCILMECPRVSSGQYLSVMCAFPVEWLDQMTPSSTERLDYMMQLGAENAQKANDERERAQAIQTGVGVGAAGIGGVASLAGVGVVLAMFRKHGREYKARFDDKYWRDVPSDDHPAVIGSLWRWGSIEPEDLTATLMRLTDAGAIKLERVKRAEKGLLSVKAVEDYRLTRVPGVADNLTDDIDRRAMKLVFDTARVGRNEMGRSKVKELDDREISDENGMPLEALENDSFLFGDFKEYAKADGERYRDRYDRWRESIMKAAEKRGFFEREGTKWQGRSIGIGVALIVLALVSGGVQDVIVGKVALPWVALPAVAGVACVLIGTKMRRRSTEANEIAAKTEALRNWLQDFTNLKEAIPADVVLWDKLLVLSVVLGVSKRVIEQLKAAAPHILEDDVLAGSYYWCMPWGGFDSAGDALGTSISEAYALTTAQVAATTAADLAGGSGGFGGGGFGGSFGGGSFGGGGGGAR